MCVSISPYSFYIPDSPICGLAASPHMPLWNGNKLKSHIKESMKTSEFRFFKSESPTSLPPLFRLTCIHSQSYMKTPSWHELPKSSYPKPILWLRKVNFEKFGLIHWTHISADAPFHAESEFVLAFDEKCLARAINIDSGPPFLIWASLPRAYENIRRGDFRVYYVCINFPVFFLYPRFSNLWSRGFPAHAPVKWKQIEKSHKRIDEDKRISLFQKRVSHVSPPFISTYMHSFTVLHENPIMARASKIELSKAHSMASKSQFWKIWPNSLDSYISRRAVSCWIRICACFWREMFGSCDKHRFGTPIFNLGFFTTSIRKHSKRRFSRLLCVYQFPRILSILQILQSVV